MVRSKGASASTNSLERLPDEAQTLERQPEMQSAEVEHHEKLIPIVVNKDHFEWDRKTITGLEVLDLAHETPAEFRVFIKRKGRDDDPVGPEQHVDLSDPENRHFRTVPKETTEG
jgi:hypothetical protein